MSSSARAQRKENFALPSQRELEAMQTLEREREQRKAQQYQRDQARSQMELQNANILAQVLIQVPPVVETNKTLLANAREYLECYSAKVLNELKKGPEEQEVETEPPDDDGARQSEDYPKPAEELPTEATAI